MRLIFAAATLVAITGCTSLTEQAQDSVTQTLPRVETIEFRNLQQYPGEVVCGEYKSTQRWGDSRGFHRFIYRAGQSDVRPSREDRAVFCSDDQAASLRALTGIEAGPGHSQALRTVVTDLSRLQAALEEHYEDVAAYPDNEKGLDGLLTPGKNLLRAAQYRSGGYLDAIPLDPWGRPYLYAGPDFAGARQPPTLMTLGADGQPGGEGDAADISLQQLHYLQHILGM
ncbi:MAG: type II secretion system protein GspG [Haliea sp.]|jgi:general secretion pathway protein G